MMKILDNKRNYYNHKFMALFILLQKKKKTDILPANCWKIILGRIVKGSNMQDGHDVTSSYNMIHPFNLLIHPIISQQNTIQNALLFFPTDPHSKC